MTEQILVIKDQLTIKDAIAKPKLEDEEDDEKEDDQNIIPESIDDVEGLEYI